MKASFHIILIFLSFNGFCQERTSKDENDTIRRIFENEKVGLVHKDGTLIIPTNYKEITPVYMYFEALTENGTMDLYSGSELIASDLDPGIQEADILIETGLIIIRKEEKVGVINEKGVIVVSFDYSAIEQIPSFDYQLKDHYLNTILILDKSEYFYSPDVGGFLLFGERVLYLAKVDGTLISDSIFNEVSFDAELNRFPLKHHEKMAFMNDQFQIDYLPYESITDFREWKLCSTGEEIMIFNRFGVLMDTFEGVTIPYKMNAIQDEEGVETTRYDEMIFGDFVYAEKIAGEDILMAIYDLKNAKIVSDWEKEITCINKGTTTSGTIVWIYKNGSGKLAYHISTADKSSGYDYGQIYQVADQFFAFKKEGETLYTLCELVEDSVFKKITSIEKWFGSLNYIGENTSVQELDPDLLYGFVDEYGNYYRYEIDTMKENYPSFSASFTMFRNANGKFGFISWNGKVVDLNADTLFQSNRSSTLIEYRVGDLWGAAEVIWGSDFKPDRSDPGKFYLLEGVALIYRMSDDEKHYVDSKGRAFYSTNTERTISKKGKFKGSEVYSDFEDKQYEAIPFVYSEILPVWNNSDFLGKGSNKKWGIISAFNDTVFPFQYDKLELVKINEPNGFFPYRDYDQQSLTTIGEKHGLLSLNLKKEIPAVYDWVHYVPDAAFIVKKDKKFGVYDYNLNERVKPVFDELFIAASLSGIYILRAKKEEKWYNVEFYEGKVPDQSTLLQAAPCDLVINEVGFVKKESGYEMVNLMDEFFITEQKNISDYLDPKHFQLKDGKIFILNSKGKPMYTDELTNVIIQEDQVMSTINGVVYSFSLSKKNKVILTD